MAEGGSDQLMSETESSLCSRHSQNNVESVSVEISTIMNRLGYGEEIRRWRAKNYRENDRLSNARFTNVIRITAGSKAEGLTCRFESDWDVLNVLNNVLCVETGINLHTIPDDMEVYRMDTSVYPGHCRLFLMRQAHRYYTVIHNALCDNGKGDVLLSSGLVLDEISTILRKYPQYPQVGNVQHERAGPSIPLSFLGVLHIDRVTSLRCHCPSILQRWASRHRHWPSPGVVLKVVSLGAYLTPVGYKGSEYKHMEWRLCFNTGETELVNNLNDTQAKVYVLLKMILKNVLKPRKKEITSYVMKNIVLWQAESNPQNKFDAESLFHWLHDGIRELGTAIATQKLSYYMVPERNLMAASGLQDKQQIKWVADIEDMMAEGPRLLLRLPKIRQAIVASPEPMLWFIKKKMELEILALEMRKRIWKLRDENGVVVEPGAMMQEILTRHEMILMEVGLRMLVEGNAVDDLLYIHRRMAMD